MIGVAEPACDGIDVASREDLRLAVQQAVETSGYSWPELRQMAETGDFPTVNARASWVILGGLVEIADELEGERA